MNTKLPEHIEQQLHRLIAEGLSAAQIAFMMRLSREAVETEIRRINTTAQNQHPGDS